MKPEQRRVGIIIIEDINKRVMGCDLISSRIISIMINLGTIINIIQIYAPVEGTDE